MNTTAGAVRPCSALGERTDLHVVHAVSLIYLFSFRLKTFLKNNQGRNNGHAQISMSQPHTGIAVGSCSLPSPADPGAAPFSPGDSHPNPEPGNWAAKSLETSGPLPQFPHCNSSARRWVVRLNTWKTRRHRMPPWWDPSDGGISSPPRRGQPGLENAWDFSPRQQDGFADNLFPLHKTRSIF